MNIISSNLFYSLYTKTIFISFITILPILSAQTLWCNVEECGTINKCMNFTDDVIIGGNLTLDGDFLNSTGDPYCPDPSCIPPIETCNIIENTVVTSKETFSRTNITSIGPLSFGQRTFNIDCNDANSDLILDVIIQQEICLSGFNPLENCSINCFISNQTEDNIIVTCNVTNDNINESGFATIVGVKICANNSESCVTLNCGNDYQSFCNCIIQSINSTCNIIKCADNTEEIICDGSPGQNGTQGLPGKNGTQGPVGPPGDCSFAQYNISEIHIETQFNGTEYIQRTLSCTNSSDIVNKVQCQSSVDNIVGHGTWGPPNNLLNTGSCIWINDNGQKNNVTLTTTIYCTNNSAEICNGPPGDDCVVNPINDTCSEIVCGSTSSITCATPCVLLEDTLVIAREEISGLNLSEIPPLTTAQSNFTFNCTDVNADFILDAIIEESRCFEQGGGFPPPKLIGCDEDCFISEQTEDNITITCNVVNNNDTLSGGLIWIGEKICANNNELCTTLHCGIEYDSVCTCITESLNNTCSIITCGNTSSIQCSSPCQILENTAVDTLVQSDTIGIIAGITVNLNYDCNNTVNMKIIDEQCNDPCDVDCSVLTLNPPVVQCDIISISVLNTFLTVEVELECLIDTPFCDTINCGEDYLTSCEDHAVLNPDHTCTRAGEAVIIDVLANDIPGKTFFDNNTIEIVDFPYFDYDISIVPCATDSGNCIEYIANTRTTGNVDVFTYTVEDIFGNPTNIIGTVHVDITCNYGFDEERVQFLFTPDNFDDDIESIWGNIYLYREETFPGSTLFFSSTLADRFDIIAMNYEDNLLYFLIDHFLYALDLILMEEFFILDTRDDNRFDQYWDDFPFLAGRVFRRGSADYYRGVLYVTPIWVNDVGQTIGSIGYYRLEMAQYEPGSLTQDVKQVTFSNFWVTSVVFPIDRVTTVIDIWSLAIDPTDANLYITGLTGGFTIAIIPVSGTFSTNTGTLDEVFSNTVLFSPFEPRHCVWIPHQSTGSLYICNTGEGGGLDFQQIFLIDPSTRIRNNALNPILFFGPGIDADAGDFASWPCSPCNS